MQTVAEKPSRDDTAASGPAPGLLVKTALGVVVVVGLGLWLPGVVSNFIHRDEIKLEEHLQGLPFYLELAKYEPKTYERLKKTLLSAVKAGKPPEREVMRARMMVAKVLKANVPYAADEAVGELGLVFIDELDQLSDHRSACYKFLFPHSGTAPGFLTAAEDPQDEPDAEEGESLLLSQAEKLHSRYGDAVMLLAQTSHQDSDKSTICRMYRSMMGNIMNMPGDDSSTLLRYLLAKS